MSAYDSPDFLTEEDPLSALPEPAAQEEIVEIERGLGFTDGFQFGCGLWAALLAAGVLSGLAFLILAFLLSFVGVSLF